MSDSELLEMELCEDSNPHQNETLTLPDPQTPQTHTLEETEERPQLRDECVQRFCHTHERAIPMQETVETLDITEESEQTSRA